MYYIFRGYVTYLEHSPYQNLICITQKSCKARTSETRLQGPSNQYVWATAWVIAMPGACICTHHKFASLDARSISEYRWVTFCSMQIWLGYSCLISTIVKCVCWIYCYCSWSELKLKTNVYIGFSLSYKGSYY